MYLFRPSNGGVAALELNSDAGLSLSLFLRVLLPLLLLDRFDSLRSALLSASSSLLEALAVDGDIGFGIYSLRRAKRVPTLDDSSRLLRLLQLLHGRCAGGRTKLTLRAHTSLHSTPPTRDDRETLSGTHKLNRIGRPRAFYTNASDRDAWTGRVAPPPGERACETERRRQK